MSRRNASYQFEEIAPIVLLYRLDSLDIII